MTAADHATAVQLLRAAAADHLTHLDPDARTELVERITGALDRCARRRAAAELRAAAEDLRESDGWLTGRILDAYELIRARADALDSQ